MKSVKLIGSVLCLVLLTACAAKQNLPTAGMQVELVKTQGSIPVLSEDETGKVLPYVASENPYLQKSRYLKKTIHLRKPNYLRLSGLTKKTWMPILH